MARTRTRVGEPQDQQHDQKTTAERGETPELSAGTAVVFANLLVCGCPMVKAVLYLFPMLTDLEPPALARLAKEWTADERVRKEVDKVHGGAWWELPAERRYQIALEKHVGEVAVYLYTTNFAEIEGRDGLAKMEQARNVLKAQLGMALDSNDPMQAFARFAHDLLKGQAEKTAAKKSAPGASLH